MSKVKYDGWCPKYFWRPDKSYLGTWWFNLTKRELIEEMDDNLPGWWKKQRKAGNVKAVKVRIVEVEDE